MRWAYVWNLGAEDNSPLKCCFHCIPVIRHGICEVKSQLTKRESISKKSGKSLSRGTYESIWDHRQSSAGPLKAFDTNASFASWLRSAHSGTQGFLNVEKMAVKREVSVKTLSRGDAIG